MKRRQLSDDIDKILDEEFRDDEVILCPTCDSVIEFYWESKYNGIRGRCNRCKTNWAES